MKILHALTDLAEVPGPVCVAIGVFDGVHLGHQALIRRAMQEAARRGGPAVALTFHPHPARVLRPETAPRLLTSTPHKARLIGDLECPVLLQVTFDTAFAAQPPEEFIRALAAAGRQLAAICVGHDWAFGRNRSGNVALLVRLGAELGFETIEIDPVEVDGEPVSSTRIRRAVQAGEFATAKKMLGRDYTILGTVRHGAQLGGRIGFPTANLAAHNEQFPPDGVYAVRLLRAGKWLDGVANVGVRPTVNNTAEKLLEVHIFDFADDCYGEDVEVQFVQFLRAEKKFPGIDDLKAQILADAQDARRVLCRAVSGA